MPAVGGPTAQTGDLNTQDGTQPGGTVRGGSGAAQRLGDGGAPYIALYSHPGWYYNPYTYLVGSPSTAVATIADNDALAGVSIVASDPDAAEKGADPGTFTVSRTGDTSNPLTVYYTVGGSATAGLDYTGLSSFGGWYGRQVLGSVTIPAGAGSVDMAVTPIDDTIIEGSETVVVTLTNNPEGFWGYNGLSYYVQEPSAATVTIADNEDFSTVTIVGADPSASERGPDPATFIVTRANGSNASPLTVYYYVGGVAEPTVDYDGLEGYSGYGWGGGWGTWGIARVTIPAGSASANVVIRPIDDRLAEGAESVVLTLTASPSRSWPPRPAGYLVGSPSAATATIADNEPSVTIAATDPDASEEGPDPGTFAVTRDGDTSAPLTVYYVIGGTATPVLDYASLPGYKPAYGWGASGYYYGAGSVTIPANASSAIIRVTPIDDTLVEGPETVVLTVTAGPAGVYPSPPPSYTVGAASTSTVTIADNEPTITLAAIDANAAEEGSDPASFAVTRTGSVARPLTVYYSASGTALPGLDYTGLPAFVPGNSWGFGGPNLGSGSVTIPAGSGSATIAVKPIDDKLIEGLESIILNLAYESGGYYGAPSSYLIGSPNTATATIADNDFPARVTLAAVDDSASETGPEPGRSSSAARGATSRRR